MNDKKHGKGTYKFSNGDIFEGDFEEGRKHGPNCVYTWADRSIFQGSFLNDKMWEGIYTDCSDRLPRKVVSGNVI